MFAKKIINGEIRTIPMVIDEITAGIFALKIVLKLSDIRNSILVTIIS